MEKLNINEVVTVSVASYKAKWRTLLLISLLSSVISVSIGAMGIIARAMAFSLIKDLLFLTFIVLTIVSFYFTSRLSVALIIASKSALSSEDISIATAYSRAKPVTWRYIGFSFLFGFMLIIPAILLIIGVTFGHLFSISWFIGGLVIVLGFIAVVYIITVFSFSLSAAALYPRESRVFAYSKKLVKGNFMRVIIIMLIPFIVILPIAALVVLFKPIQASASIQIVKSLLRAIPSVLIAPFSTLLTLEAMKCLEDKVFPKVVAEAQPESKLESQVDLY